MPSYVTPKINTEFIFYISLVDQANTKLFKTNPTIAAGDFKVSTDGGAESNLTTLPIVTPAGSKRVKVTVSAGEMNGDNTTITGSDVAGAQWTDVTINIQTSATQVDDPKDLNPDQSGVTIGTVNNVTNLVAGSGGISVPATGFTLTTGGAPTGDFNDTVSENGVFHIVPPSGGNTEAFYEFNVGTSGIPQTITWLGYAQSNGDSYTISAFNFNTSSYDPVGTITGQNGVVAITRTFDLLTSHVGIGAEAGEVRFQFTSADGTNFATDRLFCTFTEATSGIPNGSTIVLSTDATNQTFQGHNWSLDLNGKTISGSYFFGATQFVGSGLIANGNPITIDECICQDLTLDAFINVRQTSFSGTLTLTSTALAADDVVNLVDSNSGVAGSAIPAMDASAVTKTTGIQNRKWGGGCSYSINSFCTLTHETVIGGDIVVTNAGGTAEIRGEITEVIITSSLTATTNVDITSGGPITVNGTGGTVNVVGLHGGITDNSGGAVDINDLGVDMIAIQNVTNSIAIHAGLTQSATINTITLDAAASSVDGAYDPASVRIVAGTGAGQTRLILQYDGAGRIAVVDRNWKVTPDVTSQFTINSDSGREHVNEGLAQAGTSTTITLNALASNIDNAYVGQLVFIRSGFGDDQVNLVIGYNGTTKIATMNKVWGAIPNATSAYAMLPASPVMLSEAAQTTIDDILVDTGTTIPATLDTLSTQASVDLVAADVTAILEDTGTTIPATLVTLASQVSVDAIAADVTAILEDTGTTIPAILVTLATQVTVDAIGIIVTAIEVDTGTTIPNQIGALENISVTDILTQQMVESYAADGVVPTITQALMLIQQVLTEFAFSGTSNTVKKIDGVATAAIMTLDDGTNPTSSTRTT